MDDPTDTERPDWPNFYRHLALGLHEKGLEVTPDEAGRLFRAVCDAARADLRRSGLPDDLDDFDVLLALPHPTSRLIRPTLAATLDTSEGTCVAGCWRVIARGRSL